MFKKLKLCLLLPLLLLLSKSSGDSAPHVRRNAPQGFNPGPDVIAGDMADLDVYGATGTQRGLAIGVTSCNAGDQLVGFFAMPNTDHPAIAQNLFRMSGGTNGDDRFEQIGQAWVKHTYGAKQADSCKFGCQPGGNFTHLGVGCSDTYFASQSAVQTDLGSRAWINPFTGVFPATARDHTGHNHTAISHMILTEDADLNPAMNSGAHYYAELLYVTADEYAWCQAHAGQCNMYNNASYRQYNVTGTTGYVFTPVGETVRMAPAFTVWPGATVAPIEPDPGNDGRAFLACKVSGPVAGLYHYEYAIYNQNLDRAINSFSVSGICGGKLQNIGFHAPLNHPGFPNDGTTGDAGFSNTPWMGNQTSSEVIWTTDSLAQNPNANAIRWGTLYNFRFDSDHPPGSVTATVDFFKTGGSTMVSTLGPCGGATPTPTPTATPAPSATPTATPTATPCVGNLFFEEAFDEVVPPALPPGWSSSSNCWVTSDITSDTPPNTAFCPDSSGISDCALTAPAFNVPAGSVFLTFRNYFNTEFSSGIYWDGGVLEVSSPNISGGDYLDITDSHIGGTIVEGGYTGEISGDAGNPLAGRFAWSGNSHGYINTVVNLGPNLTGQTITLRWRMGSDEQVSAQGWRIDTIKISDGICPPTPTPGPSPSVTPTATPTVTPGGQAINLSTRLRVQPGDNSGVGGFIVTGTGPMRVLLRAIGPSLISFGVNDPLADPTLDLRDSFGARILFNDNWRDTQEQEILATGLPPANDLESAIVATLAPGTYTAIVSGNGIASGTGLVEIYDRDQPGSGAKLANLSTRGRVGTGGDVVVTGFVIGATGNDTVAARGIGPSLANFGITDALVDPYLELRNSDGSLIMASNDWQEDGNQQALLESLGLGLSDPKEAGIVKTLAPGPYTAILSGVQDGTGLGLVEIYDGLGALQAPPTPTSAPNPRPSR